MNRHSFLDVGTTLPDQHVLHYRENTTWAVDVAIFLDIVDCLLAIEISISAPVLNTEQSFTDVSQVNPPDACPAQGALFLDRTRSRSGGRFGIIGYHKLGDQGRAPP